MIDRHAVHALLQAGQSTKQIAAQLGVSQRTVQRVAREPSIEDADDAEARRRRGVGRPALPEQEHLQLRGLLEHLRVLRERGLRIGESTFYRLYRREKEQLPTQLMVRFEGVAGEFAQFDFARLRHGQRARYRQDPRDRRLHRRHHARRAAWLIQPAPLRRAQGPGP
jgi:transposase